MTYDHELADRIRDLLVDEHDLAEGKMFGGLAFLLGTEVVVAVSAQGSLLARVDPAEGEQLIDANEADPAVIRGNTTPGWVRIKQERLRTDRQLVRWLDRSRDFVRTLPKR